MNSAVSTLDAASARQLAEEICALPGVADLHGGRYGEVALYFPQARIRGFRYVRGEEERLEVNIVADISDISATPNLYELAESVRAVAEAHQPLPVDVIIADAQG